MAPEKILVVGPDGRSRWVEGDEAPSEAPASNEEAAEDAGTTDSGARPHAVATKPVLDLKAVEEDVRGGKLRTR